MVGIGTDLLEPVAAEKHRDRHRLDGGVMRGCNARRAAGSIRPWVHHYRLHYSAISPANSQSAATPTSPDYRRHIVALHGHIPVGAGYAWRKSGRMAVLAARDNQRAGMAGGLFHITCRAQGGIHPLTSVELRLILSVELRLIFFRK